MRRGHSAKLLLVWTAVFSTALVAGKVEPCGQIGSAAAQSGVLGAPVTGDETAAPVLNPAIYHHVAQVIWVVSDIDRVVDYWQRLGVHNIHPDGMVSFPNLTYRGKRDSARAKQVTASLGDLEIKWIQPVHGGKFWRDGLRQHGDGIRVLGYAVGSPQEFDDQIKYFSSKGVGVVVEDSWQGITGGGRIAYLDTAAQGGGHTLALIDELDTRSGAAVAVGNEYPITKITHFA
jgi:hypothetical protein